MDRVRKKTTFILALWADALDILRASQSLNNNIMQT